MTDELTLAYLAGLFEGEGTITISRNGDRRALRCKVAMTCPDPPVLFHSIWGGSLRTSTRGRRSSDLQPEVIWEISARKAILFLDDISPYFRMERNHLRVQVARSFQSTMRHRGRHRTRQDIEVQEHFCLLMRGLNRLGKHALSPEAQRDLVSGPQLRIVS